MSETRAVAPRGASVAEASAAALGSMSAAHTVRSGRAWATAAAIAPVPQHRSTTVALRGALSMARRASSSVRRRGTNTPATTGIRSPAKRAYPTITSSGSPATRRAIMTSSSAGPEEASVSRRASSCANTQPAARNRATRASSVMRRRYRAVALTVRRSAARSARDQGWERRPRPAEAATREHPPRWRLGRARHPGSAGE